MDKRTFIKRMAGLVAGPYIARIAAGAGAGAGGGGEPLKNWAGNIEYGTEELYSAGSLEQVRDYVRKESRLKVLGTRHSFNTIADSKYDFLSLEPMDGVIALDAAARTVTVGGRTIYGTLGPYIDAKGFALHNLASLPQVSIAGACSTATHGSGEKNGNLATAVSGLQMVTAAGDVVELSRAKDGETFRGAVVGLGALGVITSMTLDMQPTYMVRQYVYLNMPMSEVKDHFDEIEASGYSLSLFTDWQNERMTEVWIKVRVDAPHAFDGPEEFHGATLAKENLRPIAGLSAEGCTEQMGVPGPWYDRLPHFRMGFTPSAGNELQSEYFVPRRHAVEAILAVEKLRDVVTPPLMVSEIRTIAADDLWMSPCNGQACVTIHFTWKLDWPAVRAVLPAIERELRPFEARPHWGKLFTMAPAELRSRYAKMPEFIELARRYDPQGKFRNDFLNTNVFGA